MKKILIYGDSNTWGDNFLTNQRIPDDNQWPNLLQKELGNEYKILQEGLPGRLAGADEQIKKYKNGIDTFLSTFKTSAPVDYVIISLGTNDLQIKYNKNSKKIIEDLLNYKKIIENLYLDEEDKIKYFVDRQMPKIIYIMPINFDYKINASVIFNEECENKRKEIIKYFKENNINNVQFNNVELFEDGIHLNYEGHRMVAKKMGEVVKDEERIDK